MILKFFRRKSEPDVQLEKSLEKTRRGVFLEISRLFERGDLDDDLYEELEMLLIQADVGWDVSQKLVKELRARVARDRIADPALAREILREEMIRLLELATRNRKVKILQRGVPFVIMVVGVNGVGKTTSIAKLAAYHQRFGRSVMLAAGDTFRAAAIDQLQVWGDRLNVSVIAHQQGADPGSVVFDSITAARARDADVVIIDTAGRLHTKFNLMEELKKIRRVIDKQNVPNVATVLVVDATTGQNAVTQAQEFTKASRLDGLVVAKLDGSAKGGVIFAVTRAVQAPVLFVGTGEKLDDITDFDPDEFVDALIGDGRA